MLALVATVVLVAGFTTKKYAALSDHHRRGSALRAGPFAPSATSSQNTFNQYFAIVNKAGGVNGHPLQLVTKDTGRDPTVALQDVRDLVGQGVKVFFVQTSPRSRRCSR